jgi:hypothetical protein
MRGTALAHDSFPSLLHAYELLEFISCLQPDQAISKQARVFLPRALLEAAKGLRKNSKPASRKAGRLEAERRTYGLLGVRRRFGSTKTATYQVTVRNRTVA